MNPKINNLVTNEEEKVVERDKLFTRFNRPFFLEQHVFFLIWFMFVHPFALYYIYLQSTKQIPSGVLLWVLLVNFSGYGITVGCHRYWTHKTFKAKLPLQILLMILQTSCFQFSIHKWCLDHRVHHKYTDTDADPHNSKRGFWFSHIGWLVLPKHPELQKRLDTFDMSDLESDPVVRFQAKYYWTLHCIFFMALPVWALYYVFEMPLLHCVTVNFFKYVLILHVTFCVNSFAHLSGTRPYDRNISAVENTIVSIFANGEGYHNFHHVFPWDYKTSEFGWKFNSSTMFIDFFAWIGWAYDMKTVSQEMLNTRFKRTGDGSHLSQESKNEQKSHDNKNGSEFAIPEKVTEYLNSVDEIYWGWDDKNIPLAFREATSILKPEKRG